MTGKLAIFTYGIGRPTETFIRRHIESTYPGKTVVLANRILPPGQGSWRVDCPVYLIQSPKSLPSRGLRFIRRKMGSDAAEYLDVEGIKKFLVEQGVEVIWGHYLNVSWPFIRIANDLGIRFFAHALGQDLSRFFRDPVWRRRYSDYRDATGVIALNAIMRERLLSVGIPPEKIHIIHCGVEVPGQAPVRRPPTGRVRCLAVGRMVAKKAPLKLLDSFRLALQSRLNLHLDYVGDGPLFKQAREYVKTQGLEQSVTLHGAQPHSVVADLLQHADLFLQHSIVDPETGDEEGMPVIILEAMGYGLPVVSTKHAGIPEAVRDGVSGYLVEEGDIQGMAQRINELAADGEKRMRMGESGWKTAREKFSWQHERDRLLEVMGIET